MTCKKYSTMQMFAEKTEFTKKQVFVRQKKY